MGGREGQNVEVQGEVVELLFIKEDFIAPREKRGG